MTRQRLSALVVIWLLLGGGGLAAMLRYEKAAGDPGRPLLGWPAGAAPAAPGFTLLLFLHPHCPCSRASVGELAKIMAHAQGKVLARVIFEQPAGKPASWCQTELWAAAQAIPGVTPELDPAGVATRRFHARTSGQTLLYAQGRLVFSGGITGGRGHSGDNLGSDKVRSLLAGVTTALARSPVYGCPLASENLDSPLP
jgi:hypothetical protein